MSKNPHFKIIKKFLSVEKFVGLNWNDCCSYFVHGLYGSTKYLLLVSPVQQLGGRLVEFLGEGVKQSGPKGLRIRT